MLKLQEMGVHNINLVTPTHYIPQLVQALHLAKEKGLKIPVVYNTSGYEKVESLRLLEGLVDIYMPDLKYLSSELAEKYSRAKDYPEIVKNYRVSLAVPCHDKKFKLKKYDESVLMLYNEGEKYTPNLKFAFDCSTTPCQLSSEIITKVALLYKHLFLHDPATGINNKNVRTF